MPPIRPLMGYIGGKQKLARHIVRLFPHHTTYVEVFAGGAAVFFYKEPSPIEVLNDVDSGIVNLYRVLQDRALFDEFLWRMRFTLWSREMYYDAAATWRTEPDPVKKAHKYFMAVAQAFAGQEGNTWGYAVHDPETNMLTSRMRRASKRLPLIHHRLQSALIEHDDFRKILKRYDTPSTLFYCDPPYVNSACRDDKAYYPNSLVAQDHEELVDILKGLKGKAVLSGYPNPIYAQLGWESREFRAIVCSAGNTRTSSVKGPGAHYKRGHISTECVWFNYTPPSETESLFSLLATGGR